MTSSPHTIHTQAIVRDSVVVALKRQRLRLEVIKGPDKKKKKTFEGDDRIVIGGHESCDFVLSDSGVSRQHCEISYARDGYALVDLSSTNGTFIDKVQVGTVFITPTTRFRVGSSVLKLEALADTVEIPLATQTHFGDLVGASPQMRQVFSTLQKVAKRDTTVLILGESGTGKEVASRALHTESARSAGPFQVVDCGSLPATLAESELFGHEKGAFTGANQARAGAFEAAHQGTVFLDEIGELSMELQTRLLGVLERRQVKRVGSNKLVPVDVRVVAATNRDLRREVNKGRFREDLYFRLAIVTVTMPPLRQRLEDIDLYLDLFLSELGDDATLSEEAREQLRSHNWPGNVRELRNAVERAVALGSMELQEGAAATAKAPSASDVEVEVPFKVGKQLLIENYERAYVEALMSKFDNNITQAARGAQIDRVYLLRLLDKFDMRPSRKK
jgi:DNA-binding NtrC family response regulator